MKTIRVFVASPGDVANEREALAKVVAEINQTVEAVAPEVGSRLELVRWETHVAPAAGRPQAVVTEQIGAYDIFVGIMWKRFGSPTGAANSGTEEEFNDAYARWKGTGRPHIMFYFCQAPSGPPRSKEEMEQLARVVDFRDNVAQHALVGEYQNHDDFADTVRPHLLMALRRLLPSTRDILPAPPLPRQDADLLKAQLKELSSSYTEIRNNEHSGPARTRKLELIASRMRSLAIQADPLLDEYLSAKTPGDRLVAAVFLQVKPRADHVAWLSDRLGERQPFLGYHAAVGLLAAARALPCAEGPRLREAINNALEKVGNKPATDRYRTLNEASEELRRRCHV